MEDISPKLFNKIIREFDNRTAQDEELAALMEALPDYRRVHVYAQRLGEHLSAVLRKNISSEVLPDGKMYYNIADSVIRPLLENNRHLVNQNAARVQEALNQAANIGLRAITPVPDTQRVDGIINRLASEDNFDDVAWMLDEPVKTLSQSYVDDYIKANADFHAKAGLSPRITRTSTGNCCEWCSRLAGTYEYGSPSMPSDIFKCHNRCRCMVLYDPADGRGYQDAHSKKWYDSEEEAQIEQRKRVEFLESGAKRGPKQREAHAELYYEEVRRRAPYSDAIRIADNLKRYGGFGLDGVGFDAESIEAIRQHMFITEQPRDGGMKRFDASYEQGQAWQRLVEGKQIRRSDVVLLQHEYYELKIMKKTGCTYEEGHALTDQVFNWRKALDEEDE